MAKEVEIQDQTRKISKDEFVEYLNEVDEQYIPPISKCVVLKEYADKLLDKANIVTARYENKIVGVCAFYCDEKRRKSFVSTIGILRKFRKKGIGEKLLNEAISISKKWEMNKISLEVNAENFFAIMFYEKKGFRTSEVYEKSDLNGVSRKWKLMIKDI